jgi:hypothetical protein
LKDELEAKKSVRNHTENKNLAEVAAEVKAPVKKAAPKKASAKKAAAKKKED